MDRLLTMNLSDLQQKIYDYFQDKGYTLISPNFNEITQKAQSLHIQCICGTEKHKSYKDMLRRECKSCNNLLLKEKPKTLNAISRLIDENPTEQWVPIIGGFISSLGRGANYFGKLLTPDERGRYYFSGKLQYASIIMAEAFKIKDYEKLNGMDSQYLVRNLNKEDQVPKLKDITVITRTTIGEENGKKSRQTENFKEKMAMNLFNHVEKFKYKKIPDLSDHIIFEDGNIYNNKEGHGGKRFLTFSASKNSNYNTYCILNTNDKSYYVHVLVCMAFFPIDGKNTYDDYKDLQVDHNDGNTQNNSITNLSWKKASENIQHAYDTGLNKKVRNVTQFIKKEDGTQGEKIEDFISIAEASRKTGVPEHQIRGFCYKISTYGDYYWNFTNEDNLENWSEKFTSKPRSLLNTQSIEEKPKKSTGKQVEKYSKESDGSQGNLIKSYVSITEAAKDNNCSPSTITNSCEGKVTKISTFIWKYKD